MNAQHITADKDRILGLPDAINPESINATAKEA